MRALPLDFPNDPKVADLRDEYMFGPAFLVAPVTEQGATSRDVYLPAGSDWYNYWTQERVKGGQTITVQAPIDTIPLFVKAGSIIPLGAPVESTHETQAIAKIQVYPGADGSFTLFSDDGTTYAYENGAGSITRLHWDDEKQRLNREGNAAPSIGDNAPIEVVGPVAGR
jgi:alpha-glucosidase (family GH31 glycosyl hydrolase)